MLIYILKLAAALLAFFAAKTVAGEYKSYKEKKILICEGFLSLLSFIKNELSCRCRTVSEWALEFENEALAESGFLTSLKESGNLNLALSSVKDKNAMLSTEVLSTLEGYFLSFGKSYRNEEIAEASRVFDELSGIAARQREAASKHIKTVRVISYAVALGVIILFL